MKIVMSIFVFFCMFYQICNAQQYYPDFFLDSFFFYQEPSISAEGTGKIYLNNNNDAFSSVYNPALSSRADNIRFSYSTFQKFNDIEQILYNNYGVDVPVKNIGTFSLTRRFFNYKEFIGEPPPWIDVNYTSYNLNYSRELYRGLSGGIGFSYLKEEVPPYRELNMEYYSINLGTSYIYYLPASDYYSQYLMANVSILNLQISNSKNSSYSYYHLPQIGRVSLGYVSKYGKTNNLDVFQTDIQIEYSDLLNSGYYNTISFGGEIKFMEIISIRVGYYNIEGETFTDDDITYGLGFSYPFKVYFDIPLVIGLDYARSKYPYSDPSIGHNYFDSFALYLKYDIIK